jgi:hypothetical protein
MITVTFVLQHWTWAIHQTSKQTSSTYLTYSGPFPSHHSPILNLLHIRAPVHHYGLSAPSDMLWVSTPPYRASATFSGSNSDLYAMQDSSDILQTQSGSLQGSQYYVGLPDSLLVCLIILGVL